MKPKKVNQLDKPFTRASALPDELETRTVEEIHDDYMKIVKAMKPGERYKVTDHEGMNTEILIIDVDDKDIKYENFGFIFKNALSGVADLCPELIETKPTKKDKHMLHMALVMTKLNDFKNEVYCRKDVTDKWVMANAPCNFNASRMFIKTVKMCAPEIYSPGKSVRDMIKEVEGLLNKSTSVAASE